jgi:PAS domain S-box-containing protein
VYRPDFPESAFRELIEHGPDGIVVVNRKGEIILTNHELRSMLGYDLGELVDKPIEILVPAALRAVHVGDRARFSADPNPRPMGANLQLFAQKKDGSQLAVEIMLAPVTVGEERCTVAFVRDATERRRRQAELEEANAIAHAANKELESFSYSVAHDLRAPLRSIDGFAQALLEDAGDKLDEDGLEYLARVRAAAQRMGNLIDDLLALSRLSRAELRREPTDLARLVREVETRVRLVNPGRQVELTIDDGLMVSADPRLVTVVLENLLGNAWKFTRPRPVAHVHVGRRPDGVFYVGDDGVGFDMQFAQSLFTPFKRLHGAREFEGTGIGLATVARVIHRHGGRIWGESTPGAGATFYFTLGAEDAR